MTTTTWIILAVVVLAVILVAAFVAPPHPYGPGHRGIDLAAPSGTEVHAPATGTIAFVGAVAGRGVVTIDHGDGLVTTLEPVALGTAARVAIGDAVVTVLHTPGHAPGAVCLSVPALGCVFTGDTLFEGGPGATGRSYSDGDLIKESIRERLFALPDDTALRRPDCTVDFSACVALCVRR